MLLDFIKNIFFVELQVVSRYYVEGVSPPDDRWKGIVAVKEVEEFPHTVHL